MPRNNRKKNNHKQQPVTVVVQRDAGQSRNRGNQQRRRKNNRPRQDPTLVGQAMRVAGAAVGSLVGMPKAGAQLGATISRVTGQGDYQIIGSPAVNSLISGGPPSFGRVGHYTTIRHREMIGQMTTSTTFTSVDYPLQPGNPTTFPWLAPIASRFQKWRMKGFMVELKSTCATAIGSTNPAVGYWGVLLREDAADPKLTSKMQCENYAGAQSAAPYVSVLFGVECLRYENPYNQLFVRTGDVPPGTDIKTYDAGVIQIYAGGAQSSAVIGDIWLSYDIEFYTPMIPTLGSVTSYSDYFYVEGVTSAAPLGTGVVTPVAGSNVGCTIVGTADQIVIPANAPNGLYILKFKWAAYGPTLTFTSPYAVATNLELVPLFNNYQDVYVQSPENGTGDNTWCGFSIAVMKTLTMDGNITLTNTLLPDTSDLDILVMKVNDRLIPDTLLQKRKQMTMEEMVDSRVKSVLLNYSLGKSFTPREPLIYKPVPITETARGKGQLKKTKAKDPIEEETKELKPAKESSRTSPHEDPSFSYTEVNPQVEKIPMQIDLDQLKHALEFLGYGKTKPNIVQNPIEGSINRSENLFNKNDGL